MKTKDFFAVIGVIVAVLAVVAVAAYVIDRGRNGRFPRIRQGFVRTELEE